MVITEYLERNARLWGNDIALVEVNPSEERDAATTWREASLVAEARPDAPYRLSLIHICCPPDKFYTRRPAHSARGRGPGAARSYSG